MKIALDAMGGDRAPVETIKGAILAADEYGVDIALVGLPEILEPELKKQAPNGAPHLSIVPASDTIDMGEDDVVDAVRRRKDASINVGVAMVRSGEADAVVSAGNSGAVMAAALFGLGRLRGVERPALGTVLPYNAGRAFLIDAGANSDCKPSYLVQFAEMGAAYLKYVMGVPNPRIGLLNIGEEAGKGNELTKEAYERLSDSGLNFVGNVEGTDVHKGNVDVVVTDGFTGNVALKVGEGIADYILREVKGVIKSNILFIGASILLKPALNRSLKRLNYAEYGGGNLLGVNGIVVIAHGRSDAVAIKNGLRFAKDAAGSGLLEAMRASFAEPTNASPAGR